MNEIKLTQGYVAQVDAHMFDMLNQHLWFAHVERTCVYARRNQDRTTIMMHNVILPPQDGLVVDHIDGDGLNNQCSNLRLVTRSQQQINRRGWSLAGVKGVHKLPSGRWKSSIGVEGRYEYLGEFGTVEEASAAYRAAADRLHGNFARGDAKK